MMHGPDYGREDLAFKSPVELPTQAHECEEDGN